MTYGTEGRYKCSTPGCNTFVKPPFKKCGTCNGNSMESLGRAMDDFLRIKDDNDNNNRNNGGSSSC